MYYLLTAYYAEWPLIFFGLLTVVGAAYAHGGKYLMKDIGDMSKMPLTHYISAHLSVLYASVIPIIMAVRSNHILLLIYQRIPNTVRRTASPVLKRGA